MAAQGPGSGPIEFAGVSQPGFPGWAPVRMQRFSNLALLGGRAAAESVARADEGERAGAKCLRTNLWNFLKFDAKAAWVNLRRQRAVRTSPLVPTLPPRQARSRPSGARQQPTCCGQASWRPQTSYSTDWSPIYRLPTASSNIKWVNAHRGRLRDEQSKVGVPREMTKRNRV